MARAITRTSKVKLKWFLRTILLESVAEFVDARLAQRNGWINAICVRVAARRTNGSSRQNIHVHR